MKQKFLLMLGLSTLALTSCDTEIINDLGDKERPQLTITGTVESFDSIKSRAIGTSWEAGDAIGVSAGDLGTNVKYVTDGSGSFTAASENIYFTDKYGRKFYAYYPYSSNLSDGTVSFETSSNANYEAQKGNDFLFASATASYSDANLTLNFKHYMARMIINVKCSEEDGFDADDIFGTEGDQNSSIAYITSFYYGGKFNVTTGNTSSALHKDRFFMYNPVENKETHTRTYVLYVMPQETTWFYQCFNYGSSSNETKYCVNLNRIEMKSGYSYTFNVTVKRTGMTLDSSVTISDWEDVAAKDLVAKDTN